MTCYCRYNGTQYTVHRCMYCQIPQFIQLLLQQIVLLIREHNYNYIIDFRLLASVLCSSVQDCIFVVGKAHMLSAPSFRSSPSVTFYTVSVLAWFYRTALASSSYIKVIRPPVVLYQGKSSPCCPISR